MTDKAHEDQATRSTSSGKAISRKGWNWTPDAPVALSPLFSWPLNVTLIVRWFLSSWALWTVRVLLLGLSVITWFYLQPSLERCKDLQIDWVLTMYVRNLGLMLFVAGGLHLYFYTFGKQGLERKFDPRDLAQNAGAFLWRNQVLDNMFYTLVSGVTFWTLIEAGMMWAYANGYAPMLIWTDNPVWFACLFVLLPIWGSFHFYWIHRALHWPPLYKFAHALHHRNINVGPWSGMSMHPFEHALYLSTGLIHLVIASHPIHMLFHMQNKALEAVTSHSGFESLTVKHQSTIGLGDFFHQLHHRYFECNYGTLEMPWDRWFGSFHDGTEQANDYIRERRRKLYNG